MAKKCTGCGRLNTEPLGLNKNGEPYLACCLDNGVNYDYEEGFVDGYKKAKETLYTKEQLMDAIRLARQIDYCNADYEIIVSLKLK